MENRIRLGEEKGTIDVAGMTGDSGITTIFNLTGGWIEFTDGQTLQPYPWLRASLNHNDEIDNSFGDIMLAHRESYITEQMMDAIDDLIRDDSLAIVSLPFLKAVKGTSLERRCVSVIYDKEMKGKKALCRKFAF